MLCFRPRCGFGAFNGFLFKVYVDFDVVSVFFIMCFTLLVMSLSILLWFTSTLRLVSGSVGCVFLVLVSVGCGGLSVW